MKLSSKSQALTNLLGVLTVSFCWSIGGPLSWIATQTLKSAETTFGRCTFAFLGLLPFFIRYGKRVAKGLSRKGRLLLSGSGVLLGLHFYLFIAGVHYASLTTAVTLVAVEPVFILLVGVLGFKERLRFESFIGILLTVLGILVISVLPHLSGNHFEIQTHRTYGDVCAVLASLSYAGYYALNRAFRPIEKELLRELSPLRKNFTLASIIYFFAMLSSGCVVLFFHIKGSPSIAFPSTKVWVALLAMGIVPTIIGHTLNQIVTRRAHPVWVSLMSPGETFIALLFGYFFLGQTIHSYEAAGGFLILSGVLLAAWSEAKSSKR